MAGCGVGVGLFINHFHGFWCLSGCETSYVVQHRRLQMVSFDSQVISLKAHFFLLDVLTAAFQDVITRVLFLDLRAKISRPD